MQVVIRESQCFAEGNSVYECVYVCACESARARACLGKKIDLLCRVQFLEG